MGEGREADNKESLWRQWAGEEGPVRELTAVEREAMLREMQHGGGRIPVWYREPGVLEDMLAQSRGEVDWSGTFT